MNTLKRAIPILLAVFMIAAMSVTAYAAGTGTITIQNAAKRDTYRIYKIFDATLSESQTAGKSDSIAYTFPRTLPATLSGVFEKVGTTDYIQKKAGATDADIFAALASYIEAEGISPVQTLVAQGGPLKFEDVPYGYYYVTSSLGSAVAVTSTDPDAVIYDKNSSVPVVSKTSNGTSYSIGDTVRYTAEFDTTNYLGAGENSKQVKEYVITDTLPEFLSNVTVTRITVGGNPVTGQTFTDYASQFSTSGEFTIPWATKNPDDTYTSLYDQGIKIIIVYEATLTNTVNIGSANTNSITLTANLVDGQSWTTAFENSNEIKTYAAAIKKTNGTDPLPGAQFTIQGLQVEQLSAGVYRVVSYNPASTMQSAVLSTDENGKLYIVGLAGNASLTVTEYKAPDGYNKLKETKTLTPQLLSDEIITESGTRYYDADGNLVSTSSSSTTSKPVSRNLNELDADALEIVNNQGSLLPETGGIGTTIFYVAGAALVLGAGVFLFVRRRMSREK